ncbi:unnamed protein product [Gadus morhua 'NCC']
MRPSVRRLSRHKTQTLRGLGRCGVRENYDHGDRDYYCRRAPQPLPGDRRQRRPSLRNNKTQAFTDLFGRLSPASEAAHGDTSRSEPTPLRPETLQTRYRRVSCGRLTTGGRCLHDAKHDGVSGERRRAAPDPARHYQEEMSMAPRGE